MWRGVNDVCVCFKGVFLQPASHFSVFHKEEIIRMVINRATPGSLEEQALLFVIKWMRDNIMAAQIEFLARGLSFDWPRKSLGK